MTQLHSPWLHGYLDRVLTPDEIEGARRLAPGLYCKPGRGLTSFRFPRHLVPLLAPVFRGLDTKPISARGRPERPPTPSWDEVRAALERGGEVRPEWLDCAMSHQRAALSFCAPRPGALLHHPTGSGKTLTISLWALLYPGPVLIVTKAPVRVQFARQFNRFTRIRAYAAKPASLIRKRDKWQGLEHYFDWCVAEGEQRPVVTVGWESLPHLFSELSRVQWASISMDESHKGKSKKRVEAVPIPERGAENYDRIVRDVRRRGGRIKPPEKEGDEAVGFIPLDNIVSCISRLCRKAERRLAATATPVPDRPRDLWGQLDLIEPYAWGSYYDFAFRYCDATPGIYGGLDDRGGSNLRELAQRLTHVFHHVGAKEALAALPSKRREPWYIPESALVKPTGGWQRAIKRAKAMGPAAQREVRLAMAASAKRKAVSVRVGEHMQSNHKGVLFTARIRDCAELGDILRKLKGKDKPHKVWVSHGEDSQKVRAAILAEYQAHPGPCALVATGQSWGTGVDGLQCSDFLMLVMLPPTPGELDQWEGRVVRIGQDRPVVIYYPIAEGTADEELASTLLSKLPAVEVLAPSDGLAGAAEALAGHESNEAIFVSSVLLCIDNSNDDALW